MPTSTEYEIFNLMQAEAARAAARMLETASVPAPVPAIKMLANGETPPVQTPEVQKPESSFMNMLANQFQSRGYKVIAPDGRRCCLQ